MMQIDATSVPENDFETALSKHKPVIRANTNPAARTEIVDTPNRNLQSTKGLAQGTTAGAGSMAAVRGGGCGGRGEGQHDGGGGGDGSEVEAKRAKRGFLESWLKRGAGGMERCVWLDSRREIGH
jgi:hypothetical protein